MKACFFMLLGGFNAFFAAAQSPRRTVSHSHAWFMYNGDHRFAGNWGIHLEAQFRRADFLANPQQLLLRTGLNYHLHPRTFFTIGYCFVETYPYGNFPVAATYPERRLWEQMQIGGVVDGPVEWSARFRLEQRWSQLPVLQNGEYGPGKAVYTNRIRLLNRFSVPFGGSTALVRSLYATVYDEMMIGFGKNVGMNIFDQNRAYAAIGYKFPKAGRLELGYLNQLVFKSDGIRVENNHTLQVGFSSTIGFGKM